MIEREEPWSPNRFIPFIASNADLVIPMELVKGETEGEKTHTAGSRVELHVSN